ncbi:hypothetical protein DID73_00605, partial [Candidatus Marinamargulisbacteria bacterium SCGC AG-343-K17]
MEAKNALHNPGHMGPQHRRPSHNELKQSDKRTVAGSEVAMGEVNGPMQSSASAGDAREISAAEKSMKQQMISKPRGESKSSEHQPENTDPVMNTCSDLPNDVATNYIIPASNSEALARLAQLSQKFKKLATDDAASRLQRLDSLISNSLIAGIQIQQGPFRNSIEELSSLERLETAIKVLT